MDIGCLCPKLPGILGPIRCVSLLWALQCTNTYRHAETRFTASFGSRQVAWKQHGVSSSSPLLPLIGSSRDVSQMANQPFVVPPTGLPVDVGLGLGQTSRVDFRYCPPYSEVLDVRVSHVFQETRKRPSFQQKSLWTTMPLWATLLLWMVVGIAASMAALPLSNWILRNPTLAEKDEQFNTAIRDELLKNS